MKTYIENLVPRLKQYSAELDNTTLFIEHPWVIVDEINQDRQVFIFRKKDNELLISNNGVVEKGKWEYLVNLKSLLIERNNQSFLFNQGFLDDSVMILKKDGLNEYQLLANENKIKDFNSEKILGYLDKKYITGLTVGNSNNELQIDKSNVNQIDPYKDSNDRAIMIVVFIIMASLAMIVLFSIN